MRWRSWFTDSRYVAVSSPMAEVRSFAFIEFKNDCIAEESSEVTKYCKPWTA